MAGITCVVTIHGIGFQEPPRPPHDGYAETPGYADGLQANLAEQVSELSDDPDRQPWQTAKSLPVYVCSHFQGSRALGLKRLGEWKDKFGAGTIDSSTTPLVQQGKSVAHVALVYSRLQDLGPQPEASAETFFKGLAEHRHYGSIAASLHTVLLDVLAAHHTQTQAAPDEPVRAPASLKPRTDTGPRRHLLGLVKGKTPDPTHPAGLTGTLLQIEDDVCAYVCRNDLRERIRSFVREALLRIVARDDVDRVVINGHSNGTVIGFDALRSFPTPAMKDKVQAFVTAGSPLRKYAELFTWGFEVGNVRLVNAWENHFDPHDPVADPLAHPVGWTEADGEPTKPFDHFVSFPAAATASTDFDPKDYQVDNLANSFGGGLQAHNYWDNKAEFIPALVKHLG
jgi:hypothetical protein